MEELESRATSAEFFQSHLFAYGTMSSSSTSGEDCYGDRFVSSFCEDDEDGMSLFD
jgi:hypothetical protein